MVDYFNPVPKSKPLRNKAYRDFVRRKGEAFHHESCLPNAEKIVGDKCSDYYGVSLPHGEHKQRHDCGFESFWARKFFITNDRSIRDEITIELQRIIIQNLIGYIESKRNK